MDASATDENEATKKQDLEKRLDECSCKIDDLGALPTIDRMYFAWPQHRLTKELEKVKKQLKQVANINPKVQDEYNVKLRMLADADKRLDELQRVKSSIQTLLNNLEIQRNDTVRRTFESVNNNFGQIFQRFVPGGKGNLILNSRNMEGQKNESDTMDRYVGLGIEVSFVGSKAKMSEMNQLSGGQKTVVAVALIFAIQQFKPAPFYLFDEIDQALDERYRVSLADQIHEMSRSSQFITTTFRKELLAHAAKLYGVWCRNKVSYISEVPKNQAYDFITDAEVHE
ncbi:structural maintenance of chromosomes protein 3-like isoform X2 [Anopheles sinensis]|uniref:SMC_N domain-containing protein n=1 Tax=Anopheles sinensis TaxID=74873 RepID=A0A084VJ74_ANOSI|nr:structural maintenance of chromosomes protein 3-like isoform X2 [Anopheles sinensis]